MCQENNLKLVKIQPLQKLIPDNCTFEDFIPPYYLDTNIIGYALVDVCLANLIEKLNKEGYPTASCCCGHGKWNAFISVYIYPQKIRQFKKYLSKNSQLFQKTRKVRELKINDYKPNRVLKDGRICATFDSLNFPKRKKGKGQLIIKQALKIISRNLQINN